MPLWHVRGGPYLYCCLNNLLHFNPIYDLFLPLIDLCIKCQYNIYCTVHVRITKCAMFFTAQFMIAVCHCHGKFQVYVTRVSCSNFVTVIICLKKGISISSTGEKIASSGISAVGSSSLFHINTFSKWLYFGICVARKQTVWWPCNCILCAL
jgi:hypothetical protein